MPKYHEYKRAMTHAEYQDILEGIQKDPLYRETVRTGIDYTAGEPFRDIAHTMVNSCGLQNIVLRTSAGVVVEANQKNVRYQDPISKCVGIDVDFNPLESNYILGAPYFTKVSCKLSEYMQRALENGNSVTIEVNIKSPFGEDKPA
jgi:hypothetical protein